MGFPTRAGQRPYTFRHRNSPLSGWKERAYLLNRWITEESEESADRGVRRDHVASALLLRPGRLESQNRRIQRGVVNMAAQQQPLDVLQRVQGEYIEMPGLRLTTAQAQRLWGLDRAACDALLSALVDAKFLFRTRDGAFVRSDVRAAS